MRLKFRWSEDRIIIQVLRGIVQKKIMQRVLGAIVSQINGMSGVEQLLSIKNDRMLICVACGNGKLLI